MLRYAYGADLRGMCHTRGGASHCRYDHLHQMLPDKQIHVEIWGKNAVALDYFEICPSRFGLSEQTAVILLECELLCYVVLILLRCVPLPTHAAPPCRLCGAKTRVLKYCLE